MTILAARKQELIQSYRQSEQDNGSPQVQVAILTERIRALTEHMKVYKKDYATQRGLMAMVSKRTNLLSYLARQDNAAYHSLIASLGLRK
ncbi:MAG: 30S ribosomal protein S15 [Planctomycetota bacterium]